jgi:hypothetical protein
MRPATLKEAIERAAGGVDRGVALAEFVDAFYAEADDDRRRAMLADEPPLTGDARTDALAAAVAEYLAKQNRLGNAPRWVVGPARIVSPPWHTCDENDLGMREYLSFVSPAEFVQHGVFTEERPLRRA